MLNEDRDTDSTFEKSSRHVPSAKRDRGTFSYRADETESMSEAVISALIHLGQREDDFPSVLELPPLCETVDVEAIDQLVTGEGEDIRIEFTYERYAITVTDGTVRFEPKAGEPT